MTERVDAVVLGMGPGGEEVAGRLAEAGLAVVGTERRLLGGECPYYGCVPTKMMVRGRKYSGWLGVIGEFAATVLLPVKVSSVHLPFTWR